MSTQDSADQHRSPDATVAARKGPRRAVSVGMGNWGSVWVYEGRRGTPLWQRSRLVSDLLPAIHRDLSQNTTLGVDATCLSSLLEAATAISSLLRRTEAAREIDALPFRVAAESLAKTARTWSGLSGNGPASTAREAALDNASRDRRILADFLRSDQFERVNLADHQSADLFMAHLAHAVARHHSSLPCTQRALRRYWRRRGAVNLSPDIAVLVKDFLPSHVSAFCLKTE